MPAPKVPAPPAASGQFQTANKPPAVALVYNESQLPASTLQDLRARLKEAANQLEQEHPVQAYKIITAALEHIDYQLRRP